MAVEIATTEIGNPSGYLTSGPKPMYNKASAGGTACGRCQKCRKERTVEQTKKRKRVSSPYERSLEAVDGAALALRKLGMSEVEAYRSIAAQLHEQQVRLKGVK